MWRLVVVLAACGRVDFDATCPATATPVTLDRKAHFAAGASVGSTTGNLAADALGTAWTTEWVDGSDAAGWYRQAGTLLVWDDDWFGQGGGWDYANDLLPLATSGDLTQGFEVAHVGRLRLHYDGAAPAKLHVSGAPTIRWGGYIGTTPSTVPIDVELVIARIDTAAEAHDTFTTTISKPAQDTTPETAEVPVPSRDVVLDPGDSLVIGIRPVATSDANAWLELTDAPLALALTPCR